MTTATTYSRTQRPAPQPDGGWHGQTRLPVCVRRPGAPSFPGVGNGRSALPAPYPVRGPSASERLSGHTRRTLPTPPSTRAFTLIETVVAGTLLVSFLALLAPSLRAARNADNLADCLANLRTIGQASLTYAAEDPNELIIPVPNIEVLPVASGDLEWGGKSGIGQGYNPNNPASSIFGTAAYRGPAHRPLNPYLYKQEFVDYNPVDGSPDPGVGNINYIKDTQLDLSIYRCPGDTGYAGGGFLYASTADTSRNETAFRDEGLTAYDHYGTSYSAN
ncbi:MAG: type II secretion system protein, partial [bacterium]|nr:type II secretion system protein [bacterium]